MLFSGGVWWWNAVVSFRKRILAVLQLGSFLRNIQLHPRVRTGGGQSGRDVSTDTIFPAARSLSVFILTLIPQQPFFFNMLPFICTSMLTTDPADLHFLSKYNLFISAHVCLCGLPSLSGLCQLSVDDSYKRFQYVDSSEMLSKRLNRWHWEVQSKEGTI